MPVTRGTFGGCLRELRLKAGYGLRRFAVETGFQPSNLSNLERGKLRPPREAERLGQIAEALGLLEGTRDWVRFFDLAADAQKAPLPADVEGYALRHKAIPVLLRTAKAKKLTDREFRELADYINRHL